jgi:hypothetical protein
MKDKNSIREIKNFQKKLAVFLVFSLLVNIAVLFFFLSGFSFANFASAISNNYSKGTDTGQVNSLSADDWNNLPNDFVDQSGDSMSGALTIDGSDNSGLRLKALSADVNYWSIYSHKDYGDLNFWYGSDKVTIKKDTGNVGIGVANPSAKLEVSGTIKANDPVDNNDVATKNYLNKLKVASGQNVRQNVEIDLAASGFDLNGKDPHIIISQDDYNADDIDGNTMDASECKFVKISKLKFKGICWASTSVSGGIVDSTFDWLAIQLP